MVAGRPKSFLQRIRIGNSCITSRYGISDKNSCTAGNLIGEKRSIFSEEVTVSLAYQTPFPSVWADPFAPVRI